MLLLCACADHILSLPIKLSSPVDDTDTSQFGQYAFQKNRSLLPYLAYCWKKMHIDCLCYVQSNWLIDRVVHSFA